MRSTGRVVWNLAGQTLSYSVPQGRPTSATFGVFRDYASDDGTVEWSGSATVDSYTQLVSSASGASQADPQKINVTSTGAVTTQKYLLSEAGMSEWVAPIEIEVGYIRVRHPLRNNYTTAATLVSVNLTLAVDATFVADRAKINIQPDPNPGYRVRWAVVVGGVTSIAYTYFTVVRAIVPYQVDIDDLNARAPGLVDSIPTEYMVEQGRPLIAAAWQSVQADLSNLKLDSDALRDDSITDELVTLRSLNLLACGGWKPLNFQSITDYIKVTHDNYATFLEQHFESTLKHKISEGTHGGAVRMFAEPSWSK